MSRVYFSDTDELARGSMECAAQPYKNSHIEFCERILCQIVREHAAAVSFVADVNGFERQRQDPLREFAGMSQSDRITCNYM